MKILTRYAFLILGSISGSISLLTGSLSANEGTLLRDGFAAVAVSTESIEAIYLQAIENDDAKYAKLGADWDEDASGNNTMIAGVQVFQDRKIFFDRNSGLNMSEIAFENVRPNKHVQLTRADIAEINEAMIISYIKTRTVDPKMFNVNLNDPADKN